MKRFTACVAGYGIGATIGYYLHPGLYSPIAALLDGLFAVLIVVLVYEMWGNEEGEL